MNKHIEKFFYATGINLSHYDVSKELQVLEETLPTHFVGREVIDIGCGNGKVSKKLISTLKTSSFKGVDLYPALVNSARKNGITAEVVDVEKEHLSGDLGVLWGTLHHFEQPIKTLKRLCQQFNAIIIRENINEHRILEFGDKYNTATLMNILEEAGLASHQYSVVPLRKQDVVLIYVTLHN